ncbi:MAG: hypothetical protein RLN81_00785 [Balneolaceae bacterium]
MTIHFNRSVKLVLILGAGLMISLQVNAQELSGFIETELRLFPDPPAYDDQHLSTITFAIEPEYYRSFGEGNLSFYLTPFVRLDGFDSERTHFDIRELYFLYYKDDWELKAGAKQIFWGVTESAHLVDIINQTDLVENLDAEEKLGQPMLNFSLIKDWGTLDFFYLPYFRERTFQGKAGRLRFQAPIQIDGVIYDSDAKEWNPDFAVRYSHYFGNFDIGLSQFYGTSREPAFRITQQGNFVPKYFLMSQTGLDLQYTGENGWLWKWESIFRATQSQEFFAFTGGFEYTFSNVRNSGADIGVLTEYLWDERENSFSTPAEINASLPPNAFNNHLFVGSRVALNDVQSTAFLAGGTINLDEGSMFLNVEAERRFGDRWIGEVQLRAFANPQPDDFLYVFRKDSYLQLSVRRYF